MSGGIYPIAEFPPLRKPGQPSLGAAIGAAKSLSEKHFVTGAGKFKAPVSTALRRPL
jgi:hypothetical protein